MKQVSATESGILVIPLSVSFLISLLCSGSIVSCLGYYTPLMLITSILTPIASGLLTTLKIDATISSLIGYQAFLGFAAGIGFQGPTNAVQTILSTQDVSIGVAAIQFSQSLGPAIFVPVAQSIFTDRLRADLSIFAPNLDSTSLEDIGFSNLKDHVKSEDLEGALLSYDVAIRETFFVVVALTCASLLGSLGMDWRSVRKKKS